MKSHRIQLFALMLAVSGTVAACSAAEIGGDDKDVIRFGVPRSTVIISGRLSATSMGGGGATSTVAVGEVLKSPKGSQVPKEIPVFWLSAKDPGWRKFLARSITNSFLFFLRPASTNAQTGYRDVTGKVHPFVQATEANVHFLRSQLLEQK
jgi:hypothetical protein